MTPEALGIIGLGVTILLGAAGGLVGYGRLEGRVTALEKQQGALDAGLASITTKLDALGTQLATLLGELRERARHEKE